MLRGHGGHMSPLDFYIDSAVQGCSPARARAQHQWWHGQWCNFYMDCRASAWSESVVPGMELCLPAVNTYALPL